MKDPLDNLPEESEIPYDLSWLPSLEEFKTIDEFLLSRPLPRKPRHLRPRK